MTIQEDIKGQLAADDQLHREIAPILHLLNAINSQSSQWRRAFAKNDCVDEFGVPIPAGRDHYRQGDFYEDAFRLSAQSMHTFMRVLFLNNHLGFKLAEDLHDEFLNKLLTLQRTRADAKSTASQAGAQ